MVTVAQSKRIILKELRSYQKPASSPGTNKSTRVGISSPETCPSSEKICTSVVWCTLSAGTKMSPLSLFPAEMPMNYPFHFFTILPAAAYSRSAAVDEPFQESGYTKNLSKYTSRGTIAQITTVIASRRP
jgi:hypothetical protein